MKIHNHTAFLKAVEAERMRSERAQSVFSILSIAVSDPACHTALLAAVIKVLSTRIRCYDALGWIDEHHLGVLLPDTPAEGAQTILGDMITSIAERHRLICSIVTYPPRSASCREYAAL